MLFNSHIERLAVATVNLVNAVTPGQDGLREIGELCGEELRQTMSVAVAAPGYEGGCTIEEAARLVPWVGRCRAVIELLDEDRIVEAADLINQLLEDTQAQPRLDPGGDGGFGVHFHGPDDSFDRGWAAGLASGLAMAVGGGFAHRFGVCRASGCDRVWVDFSKNAHRRFCSQRCQSRTKAAAHRARTR